MDDNRSDLLYRLAAAERALQEQTHRCEQLEREHRALLAREGLEAERRLAAVGRIAGGIAHEINNPLTVLQLRADLLLEEPELSSVVRQQLLVIRDSTSRIARTVRMLQRMGRPPPVTTEWVAVRDIVQQAREGARAWLPSAPIALVPLERATFVGVRGDPQGLVLALEQLLIFAIETGPVGLSVVVAQDRVQILIEVERADWPEVIISDLSMAPTLSEPSAKTGHGQERSLAFGLTVAAAIARDHDGTVRTMREGSRGVILVLDLPLDVEGAPESW